MLRLTLALSTLAALLAAGCATTPTGRHQLRLVSDEQMSQMGVAAFQQMKQESRPVRGSRESQYVRCVANAVTREMGGQWEVQVFEDDKQVNAFALPGGKIGVYTGLLKVARNQDQLAAVIGHETAHVVAGHSAARVSNQMAAQLGVEALAATTGYNPQLIGLGANLLVVLPFSRGDESEADALGLDYMARAGFDPRQAVELWHNMEREGGGAPPQILSTHPSTGNRIRELESRMPSAMPVYEQAKAAGKRPGCGSPG